MEERKKMIDEKMNKTVDGRNSSLLRIRRLYREKKENKKRAGDAIRQGKREAYQEKQRGYIPQVR